MQKCFLSLAFIFFAGLSFAVTDTTDKGTLQVNPSYNWTESSVALDALWSIDSSEYTWGINRNGMRYKLCWRKRSQVGDACWFNKELYSEMTIGVQIVQNLLENEGYHVKLEAYGRKDGAFPTSFFKWRVVGRVNVNTGATMACGQPITWWDSSVNPHFDGANCYVYDVPSGYTPFVWHNGYYVKTPSPGVCTIGQWDGANCWLGSAPSGTSAFLYMGNFYYAE